MARFPSLPERPQLADVFKRFGRGVRQIGFSPEHGAKAKEP